MNVLQSILKWSESLPGWQRDALRRLVASGDLADLDIEQLMTLSKIPHGLAKGETVDPLQAQHIPATGGEKTVSTSSVVHHHGVNALASEQGLTFGPRLTIVYGDNAAGKSGFTRILKRACRARGAEEILRDVRSDGLPPAPSATITFKRDDESEPFEFTDSGDSPEELSRISVFDSHSAAVYVNESTDVAFRPFGLDLFDKLSSIAQTLRQRLDRERDELRNNPVPLPELSQGTTAQKAIATLNSLANIKDLEKLGTLSHAEERRRSEVAAQVQDLRAADPEKAAKALTLRADRMEPLQRICESAEKGLSKSSADDAFAKRDSMTKAQEAVSGLQSATFSGDLLPGTGSDIWRRLWEAARSFSDEEAYVSHQFPHTGDSAHCVLCQQLLEGPAKDRLKQFEEYVRSETQDLLKKATDAYSEALHGIEKLELTGASVEQRVQEIGLDNPDLEKRLEGAFEAGDRVRNTLLADLKSGKPLAGDLSAVQFFAAEVMEYGKNLRSRAQLLIDKQDEKVRKQLEYELAELESRRLLGEKLEVVAKEVERHKRIAAYGECLRDVDTGPITRKSTEVTQEAVTKQLQGTFKAEIQKLGLTYLGVQLEVEGGRRGTLYHRLRLQGATSVDLGRVVSEGEARTLSLAAFFSELSTAAEPSTIIFDDPVSSLDHLWRENVVRRLAEESRTRQVIVFTHDITFLLALQRHAEELGVDCQGQQLRRDRTGAGISSSDLPWKAMKVNAQIGVLRNDWQQAEKTFRTGSRDDYDREAQLIYGRLREAWERGAEQVLLGGVVERYRPNIQTQQIAILSAITKGDCEELEAGMTKSSRWLVGHDKAPAENTPVPEPDEIYQDIEALEKWVKRIGGRKP